MNLIITFTKNQTEKLVKLNNEITKTFDNFLNQVNKKLNEMDVKNPQQK